MSLENNLSRRTFVKGTTVATGGLVFGATKLTAANAAYGASADTLKLAVIGCGGRGRGAVRQALTADKGVELVAMADAFRPNRWWS